MANTSSLEALIRRTAEQRCRDATISVQAVVTEAAPRRTGALANSIGTTPPLSTGSVLTSRLFATAPQAEWTDKGTRAHTIRPRSHGVLAFFWESRGADVFLRVVHHPGNKGTGWFSKDLPLRWHTALVNAEAAVHG